MRDRKKSCAVPGYRCSLRGGGGGGRAEKERVVISFSRGSSWPRDQTHVSCIAGRFSTIWAIGKSQILSCVWLFATPWNSPWNSPGQNTVVGSLSLLQGIFLTQRLNPGLPHCRQILYQLSHQGSPKRKEEDRKGDKVDRFWKRY